MIPRPCLWPRLVGGGLVNQTIRRVCSHPDTHFTVWLVRNPFKVCVKVSFEHRSRSDHTVPTAVPTSTTEGVEILRKGQSLKGQEKSHQAKEREDLFMTLRKIPCHFYSGWEYRIKFNVEIYSGWVKRWHNLTAKQQKGTDSFLYCLIYCWQLRDKRKWLRYKDQNINPKLEEVSNIVIMRTWSISQPDTTNPTHLHRQSVTKPSGQYT